jgi:hypothetical protein
MCAELLSLGPSCVLLLLYGLSIRLGRLLLFLIFHQLTRKHLVLLTDMVSRFKSFSEASCLAQKCGTHRSDNPVRVL